MADNTTFSASSNVYDNGITQYEDIYNFDKYKYEDTQNGETIYNGIINSNSIKEHYGNSYFMLSTVNNRNEDTEINTDENIVSCDGVLREMPEMGINTTWEDGPAKTFADKVTQFIKNDALDAIQYLSPKNTKKMDHFIFSDEWTAKVYEDAEMNSITLSFRCYTKEQIGYHQMANAPQWIRFLTTFAPPAISTNPTTAKDFKDKVNNTANATKETLTEVKNIMQNQKNHAVASFLRKIDNSFLKKFDSGRVISNANESNSFGAKLFHLHIYPFLFKKPFPVYISNWKMTPSKEMIDVNNNQNRPMYEHVYYDFEITCEMDQLYTSTKFLNLCFA